MLNAHVGKQSIEPSTILAIYQRTSNFLKNEESMGNTPPVLRAVLVYALMRFMSDHRKEEHEAQINDAKFCGILDAFARSQDVPLVLEAINLMSMLSLDYIPPAHLKPSLRELYDITKSIHQQLKAADKQLGPVGWQLQPTAGNYLEANIK